MASIPASEILLFSVCRAGQRNAIGGALDHESRDRNGLCRPGALVKIPIARVLPRLVPANRVGMHGNLRPIRIFERFGGGLEFRFPEPALRRPGPPLVASEGLAIAFDGFGSAFRGHEPLVPIFSHLLQSRGPKFPGLPPTESAQIRV